MTLNANISLLMPDSLKKIAYRYIYRSRRVSDPKQFISAVAGLHGLEVGGPSIFFEISLPLYQHSYSIDGVNFAHETIWEGSLTPDRPFSYYKKRSGRQFIAEATALCEIKDDSYDFVLSCHSLEHVANPLKALLEWNRVLKPGGALILVVPNKVSIFDHRRATTTFSHLLSDYEANVDEHDLTHLSEIIELHDLAKDRAAGSLEQFHARSIHNFENRGLHHHVVRSTDTQPSLVVLIFRHSTLWNFSP